MIFNWDLKTCNISSMFFKLAGSLFHEDGPETEKERGPKVLVRVRGMWRLPCAAEELSNILTARGASHRIKEKIY